MATLLMLRQDNGSVPDVGDVGTSDTSFTIEVTCDTGNEFDGRLGLRISAIFVILVGSLLGALTPVVLARASKLKVPKLSFFIAKYFGSGVIIGTAFMHLLSPAFAALTSPCLNGPITDYDWAAGIVLMTVMAMFFIELTVARFDMFGGHKHDHEGTDPSLDVLRKPSPTPSQQTSQDIERSSHAKDASTSGHGLTVPGPDNDVTYPPGGEDHLGHSRSHEEGDSYADLAAQMTAIFILEFGVIFHSIFIGLTLAVAGEEFVVLYIVLVFHQTFEGMGLGSRLATAQWPKSKSYMPYLLACLYAISTPLAIAVGLGVRETLQPGSASSLIINGIFDSISAGILLYTGLVELLAHEFMFSPHMRNASVGMQFFAYACVALGCGLMAVLAKWA